MHKLFRIGLILSAIFIQNCGYPPLESETELPDDYTYIIGPLDSLEIFVWDNPDISSSVTVRPDGKINTPLLDDLVASGKTPSELARDIENGLSKFVRDPLVAVMVGDFEGVYYQQVRVIGEVRGGRSGSGGGNNSGGTGSSSSGGSNSGGNSFPYRKEMTLLDLIIELGGLSQFADGNRASIIRKVNGEQKQFGVRIDDLIEDGDMTANVKILPGDILFIPEAFF